MDEVVRVYDKFPFCNLLSLPPNLLKEEPLPLPIVGRGSPFRESEGSADICRTPKNIDWDEEIMFTFDGATTL